MNIFALRAFMFAKFKILFLFLISIFLIQCQKQAPKSDKPIVLVTIAPYNYFVERIAGDTVDIQVLIPPSVNVHHYEPAPKQIEILKDASVWFQMGEPLEQKVENMVRSSHILIRVNLFEILNLNHSSTSADVHTWLSPKLVEKQIRVIYEVLSNRFPEHQEIYLKNFQEFEKDLILLDEHIQEKLSEVDYPIMLVSHPAFNYFCEAYGCKQISIEQEGKEPLPKDLDLILKQAQENQIQLIIGLPQFSLKGAEWVSHRLDIPIYMFDPYSTRYEENMFYLAKLIVESSKK